MNLTAVGEIMPHSLTLTRFTLCAQKCSQFSALTGKAPPYKLHSKPRIKALALENLMNVFSFMKGEKNIKLVLGHSFESGSALQSWTQPRFTLDL